MLAVRHRRRPNPPDLPGAWATATRAVTRDPHCRRHGRPITLTNMLWRFAVSEEWVALGFETPVDADVGAYQRCLGYRLEASPAQALVWLADDVQYELTGYEFVQWPIAGQRILEPRIIDDHAVWVDPRTNTVTAPIGELCTALHPPEASPQRSCRREGAGHLSSATVSPPQRAMRPRSHGSATAPEETQPPAPRPCH
jgi:hypothetical protein